MAEALVAIQIIRVYQVRVEADSEDDALDKARGMSVDEIEEQGSHRDTTTGYAEVLDFEGGDDDDTPAACVECGADIEESDEGPNEAGMGNLCESCQQAGNPEGRSSSP